MRHLALLQMYSHRSGSAVLHRVEPTSSQPLRGWQWRGASGANLSGVFSHKPTAEGFGPEAKRRAAGLLTNVFAKSAEPMHVRDVLRGGGEAEKKDDDSPLTEYFSDRARGWGRGF